MNSNMFDSEKTLNSFYIDSSETYKLQEVFNDTNSCVSTWSNGTFSNGTWYNGEWIDGEWLTNDNN